MTPFLRSGVAGLALAASLAGCATTERPRDFEVVDIEQTADAVLVTIRNPNRHHELRQQGVRVLQRGSRGEIIRGYFPDADRGPRCCVIDYLPPRGTVTLRMPAVKEKVATVTMHFYLEPGWIRT